MLKGLFPCTYELSKLVFNENGSLLKGLLTCRYGELVKLVFKVGGYLLQGMFTCKYEEMQKLVFN